MTSERFHKAARDSILLVLKEATKRDCNARDEDGMTPTMWAAFEGHLDALRLLVSRGGDPDKGDNFANTALHHAADRGHMSCVTFLVNFGANLWALNCDMQTPKELAAINSRDDVLRFLDEAIIAQETTNRKEVKAKKEKAQKEVEKRMKEYQKVKKKADKYAEQQENRLKKDREKMSTDFVDLNGVQPHRPSTVLMALKNKALGTSSVRSVAPSPRFSEIVGTVSAAAGRKLAVGSVARKAQMRLATHRAEPSSDDFKVVEVEDGRKSVRNLTGLRRDSEVLYVGRYDGDGKRGKLAGVFEQDDDVEDDDSKDGDTEDVLLQEPASIFDRPGFGSFAFRKSITSTLSALPIPVEDDGEYNVDAYGSGDGNSIGSAGSLAKRQNKAWQDQNDSGSDDLDSLNGDDWSPLQLFLVANGLAEYTGRFVAEKIDLEALLLLTDEDLTSLGLPLGPRRKLTQAISNRRKVLEAPGQVHDSQL